MSKSQRPIIRLHTTMDLGAVMNLVPAGQADDLAAWEEDDTDLIAEGSEGDTAVMAVPPPSRPSSATWRVER